MKNAFKRHLSREEIRRDKRAICIYELVTKGKSICPTCGSKIKLNKKYKHA